jgi:hypothetical protein
MRIKLIVTCKPGDQPVEVITNLLCIAEWERIENRKLSDGKGVGASDLVAWAYNMFKQSGRLMPEATWREWLTKNPDMDIDTVDLTNPNPTEAAATAEN